MNWSDLKIGMFVKIRTGEIFVVMDGYLSSLTYPFKKFAIGSVGERPVCFFDYTNLEKPEYDIMMVSKDYEFKNIIWTGTHEVSVHSCQNKK